jgi:hypothetical protein
MCQAYEGERSYLLAQDKWVRSKGYSAHKEGVPRDANPEPDHSLKEYSRKHQWWLGWDTAELGHDQW